MKKYFKYMLSALVALGFVSCANEDDEKFVNIDNVDIATSKLTFSSAFNLPEDMGSLENEGLSKISFDKTTDVNNETVLTFDGDEKFKLWTATSDPTAYTFVNTSSSASKTIDLTCDKVDESDVNCGFYAIYPANRGIELNGNVITATIPTTQIAAANNFASDAFLVVAYAEPEERDFTFKSACSMVKLTFEAPSSYTSAEISVEGGNISGDLKIAMNGKNISSVKPSESNATNKIILTPKEGNFQTGSYYVCCSPTTNLTEISVVLKKDNGEDYRIMKLNNVAFEYNKYKAVPVASYIAGDKIWSKVVRGGVECVDLGIVSKGNRYFWTKGNLGAHTMKGAAGSYYGWNDVAGAYGVDEGSHTTDPVKATLGGAWKLPSMEDFNALMSGVTLSVNNKVVTAKGNKGNSLVFPYGDLKYSSVKTKKVVRLKEEYSYLDLNEVNQWIEDAEDEEDYEEADRLFELYCEEVDVEEVDITTVSPTEDSYYWISDGSGSIGQVYDFNFSTSKVTTNSYSSTKTSRTKKYMQNYLQDKEAGAQGSKAGLQVRGVWVESL